MAAPRNVSFTIRARDATRAAFRSIGRSVRFLRDSIFSLNSLIAGALGAGVLRLAANSARASQDILQASRAFSLTEDELEALRFIFQRTGGDLQDVLAIVTTLQGELGRIRLGDTEAEGVFRRLGFSSEEIERSIEDTSFAFDRLLQLVRGDTTPAQDALLARLLGDDDIIKLRNAATEASSLNDAIRQLNEAGLNRTTEQIREQAELARQVRETFEQIEQRSGEIVANNRELIFGVLNLAERTLEILNQANAPNNIPEGGRSDLVQFLGQGALDLQNFTERLDQALQANTDRLNELLPFGPQSAEEQREVFRQLLRGILDIVTNTDPANQTTLTEQ